MGTRQNKRLTDRELTALLDRLFPHGFASEDVLAEIAPEGWKQSPLLACSHPSVARVFDETLQVHRNIEALCRARAARDGGSKADVSFAPEPTLDEVCREYRATPVRQDEEVTTLVGQCLWDVFSDNHEVIVADGRVAGLGSFRSAAAFLDAYVNGDRRSGRDEGDGIRFYMGTIWIAGRADLTPVYTMIFTRLQSIGADWIYHFPDLGIVGFSPLRVSIESSIGHSPAEALVADQRGRERKAALETLRAELAEMNADAREGAMDRPAPRIVSAYRRIYGHDPRGWPPA